MSKSEWDQAVVERSVAENGNPSVFVRSDGFGSSVVIAMKKLGGWGMKEGGRKRSQVEWRKENCDGASTGREDLGVLR